MIADWKPIATAPKDGTKIMVYECDGNDENIEPAVWDAEVNSEYVEEPVLDKYGEPSDYVWRGGWVGNGINTDEEERILNPTHWDYMPAGPKKQGE